MKALHFHLFYYRLIHNLLIIDTHEKYTTFIYEKNNILIRNKIIKINNKTK